MTHVTCTGFNVWKLAEIALQLTKRNGVQQACGMPSATKG